MTSGKTRFLFATACAVGGGLYNSPADAQNVVQAYAELQPLSYTDAEGYKGCGLRAMALSPPPSTMTGVDLSVNLWIRPKVLGMVKVSSITAEVGPPPSLDRKPPARISLALESTGKPLPMIGLERSEDGLYIFGASDAVETTDLMARLFAGERVLVGVHMTDTGPYFVFAFTGRVSPQDAESFHSCMRAVLGEVEAKENS